MVIVGRKRTKPIGISIRERESSGSGWIAVFVWAGLVLASAMRL